MVFRLDLGQTTFNLVKNALAPRQLGFLATGIAFCHVFTRACAEIKVFGRESDLSQNFDFCACQSQNVAKGDASGKKVEL